MNLALSLFEATVSLYPQDAAGAPVVSAPIWLGACIEKVAIRETWLKREIRPTGRRYPRRRPLVPQFEISLDRIWIVTTTNRAGYQPGRAPGVMDILWREEETDGWRRETYYGVTISARSRESKDLDARDGAAFLEQQTFEAESVVVTSGTGTPPALGLATTYRVSYQSATEQLDLYEYDALTELFTALASTTGRATITYNPTDRSNELVFAFAGVPVASVNAAGDFTAQRFVAGAPTGADLPRLNFYAGNQRVASLTAAGLVYATAFLEAAPSGTGIYFYGGSARRVLLTPPLLVATNFIELNPGVTADSDADTADTTLLTADMTP